MNDNQWKMYNAIIRADVKSTGYIGENSIQEEFEEKQYIPTTISNLLTEKVTNDLDTIKKAIELMKYYKSIGVDVFDYDLDIILNKIKGD